MFKKILIANRGEIACRVIQTCNRMGIRTIAVYSEVDSEAMHVQRADEAYCIGKAAPAESYLNIAAILNMAKEHRAEAIHPGYGFLSENADFARKCQTAGVTFIGPHPDTIEKMGSKSRAKTLMEAAKVPVVPGYHGDNQDPGFLKEQANKIGFPLLIKAVHGGGGKGMRIVRNTEEFNNALEAAKREAFNAFGNDHVLLERFVEDPHHIEFQIFGDSFGNVVHLFERECSIQRRHQKIIEETPSPFLDQTLRRSMGKTAVQAAKAVDYIGAGTVEFIVGADREFFFMEMNTRLQVEHPVTEMTTGFDLVEWQIRVADNEPLPAKQSEIHASGHAIEVRIYAENPKNDFLPSIGKLNRWIHPELNQFHRLDAGVEEGDTIGIHYDPMVAKLIVGGEDRHQSVRRMQAALSQTAVIGLSTNIHFLQSILQHEKFIDAKIDTSFIDKYWDDLNNKTEIPPDYVLWAAGIRVLMNREVKVSADTAHPSHSSDPFSPWNHTDHWRLNSEGYEHLMFNDSENQCHNITLQGADGNYKVESGGQTIRVKVKSNKHFLSLQFDDRQRFVQVLNHDDQFTVLCETTRYEFTLINPLFVDLESVDESGHIEAPMPGKVTKVMVKNGDSVEKGQPLMILEAMKMEHTLRAPKQGTVDKVVFEEGELVEAEVTLITFVTDTE